MKEFQWIGGIDDEKVGEYLRKIEEMFAKLYPAEEGIKKVYLWVQMEVCFCKNGGVKYKWTKIFGD